VSHEAGSPPQPVGPGPLDVAPAAPDDGTEIFPALRLSLPRIRASAPAIPPFWGDPV